MYYHDKKWLQACRKFGATVSVSHGFGYLQSKAKTLRQMEKLRYLRMLEGDLLVV
jgi:hypothetical protein